MHYGQRCADEPLGGTSVQLSTWSRSVPWAWPGSARRPDRRVPTVRCDDAGQPRTRPAGRSARASSRSVQPPPPANSSQRCQHLRFPAAGASAPRRPQGQRPARKGEQLSPRARRRTITPPSCLITRVAPTSGLVSGLNVAGLIRGFPAGRSNVIHPISTSPGQATGDDARGRSTGGGRHVRLRTQGRVQEAVRNEGISDTGRRP